MGNKYRLQFDDNMVLIIEYNVILLIFYYCHAAWMI